MKYVALVVFIVLKFSSVNAQSNANGVIYDAAESRPLPYVYVVNLATNIGVLSNNDGYFSIAITSQMDSLFISHLGYSSIVRIASDVEAKIELQKESYVLAEINVTARDDYAYEILKKCKSKLAKTNNTVSKGYLSLETTSNSIPTEFLQAFYNANHQGISIEELDLKMGKIALSAVENNYFVTLGTTKAICNIDLLKSNKLFPKNPFQIRRVKSKYDLKVIGKFDDIIKIRATPIAKQDSYFSGELWINLVDYSLRKIILSVENAACYPFRPIDLNDSLKNVNFEIEMEYSKQDNHFNYLKNRYTYDYLDKKGNRSELKKIESEAILFNYDFENPFLLPFYTYNYEHDDYRKISFFPFDSLYWAKIKVIENSLEQKESLDYFANNGFVLNFLDAYNFNSPSNKSTFFEDNNLVWSKDDRISLKPRNLDVSKLNIIPKSEVKVQIMLDVRDMGDSLKIVSESILDVFESNYYLSSSPKHLSYLNIYFDLCEMNRRELLENLGKNSDVMIIKDKYEFAAKRLEEQLKTFTRETNYGENTYSLQKWSDVINGKLGIDNITYFMTK